MAAVTAPGQRRSLIGAAVSALAARSRAKPGRLAALAARARQHVVTLAALTSVDLGAWHYGHGPGWVVTGVLLLVADFAVTG